MPKKYTTEQKLAYYKALAAGKSEASAAKKRSKRAAPKRKVYKKDSQWLAPALGSVGSAVGNYFVPLAGGAVGHALGTAAGNMIKQITGYGDYKVSVNTLITDSVPEFRQQGPRSTIVRHREFVRDIISAALGPPTPFENVSLRINPGDPQTFPWLSQVAQNYEQYRMHGLIFEYKTQSGSLSTSGQLGTVVMATQYNSLSPAFANKQQMENYEFATSVKASESVIHPVECDPKQTQCNGIFNVQTTRDSPSDGDLRLYDLGRFNIATVGMPDAQETVGELWVSYEVCLMKPRMDPDSGSSCDHWTSSTGITGSVPFGDFPTLSSGSDDFTRLTTDSILFDRSFVGNVCVVYDVAGATAGVTGRDALMTGSNGATALNLLQADTINQNGTYYDPSNFLALHSVAFFSITPQQGNGDPPKITFSNQILPLEAYSMSLFVMQISSDIN